jgi:hypothetical protein
MQRHIGVWLNSQGPFHVHNVYIMAELCEPVCQIHGDLLDPSCGEISGYEYDSFSLMHLFVWIKSPLPR